MVSLLYLETQISVEYQYISKAVFILLL